MTATDQRCVAFVLASWTPDAPAGMERATAAAAHGLVRGGHRALIITAAGGGHRTFRGATVVHLRSLTVPFPAADAALRTAIIAHEREITVELLHLYAAHQVDTVVYVDALWGLGRIMPTGVPHRRVLAVHVIGHRDDMTAALSRIPTTVIVPSDDVLVTAAADGYIIDAWQVVPNGLLFNPAYPPPADREALRQRGPIRVLARLGPEKGVVQLLKAMPSTLDRRAEVRLAAASFEEQAGGQQDLFHRCAVLADRHPALSVRPGGGWRETTRWLAAAAVVIVPSLSETFGLVALEAMAGATPVAAFSIGNLPYLIRDGGIVIDPDNGPAALWRVATDLLADPLRYGATSRAAYYRTRDYRPALVADQLLKVVS